MDRTSVASGAVASSMSEDLPFSGPVSKYETQQHQEDLRAPPPHSC